MNSPLQNDLLLRALLRQPTPRTPLWMMRQAGRYLPEYRATRAKAGSFLQLCMNPELACEVTLQPLDRYRLDAAILFSDILTVPHAMNVGLSFETGEGPKIARPVRTPADTTAVAQMILDGKVEQLDRSGIERGLRLVEQPDRTRCGKEAGQREPSLLPGRQEAGGKIGKLGQSE